jgi:replicative DNA helicase
LKRSETKSEERTPQIGLAESNLNELLEAESMILGAILLEPSVMYELTTDIVHFTQEKNKLIFSCMKKLQEDGMEINPVTLVEELGDQIEYIGGVHYITELAIHCPTVHNIKNFEEVMLKTYERNRIKQAAQEFLYYGDDDAANNLYKTLIEINTDSGAEEEEKEDILRELFESLYEENTEQFGISSGFQDLNSMTGGWKKGELIILAARPSMGKTALALQLAWEGCKNNAFSLLFSLEMGSKQIYQRLICNLTETDMLKWNNPYKYMNTSESEKITSALGTISNADIDIVQQGIVTIPDIRKKIMNIKRDFPEQPLLVVIDYLQLITVKEKFERHDLSIGSITKQLKAMAREFNIPIILLSQLSRSVELRADKRPMLSDLRDSGNIEQDADIVMFIYRDDYYDQKSIYANQVEIKIAKNRNGPVGSIHLGFKKECGRFETLTKKKAV